MGAATVAVLNTKINADPRGLLDGFSQAQAKTRNFAQTFKQMQSQLQATQARGAAIEMSVRTPREELQSTLNELGRLRADGVITMETLSRATANARDRFRQLDPVIQDNTRRLQELRAQAEALRARGNSIAINVRTPREDMQAAIRDLQHLRSVGAISQQTLARATADARDRFRQLDPAIQAATARIQEMRSRGAAITMDVRTPRESLAATMTELRTLRREGVITFETFNRAAAQARDSVNQISSQAVSPLISRMKTLALVGGASLVAGFVGTGLKLAGEAQTTEVAFRVMTGSAKSAFELIAQLKQTAMDSPLLNYTDTLEAGRRLLAVGFAAGEVNNSIRMLADISAGTKQPIGELAMVLGDVRAKTKLTGEETRQFTSRGIPLIQALADMYGKTTTEVLKMREAGEVSFSDVYKALESMTKAGGRFHNLQAEMANTLPGKMAKLTDSTQMLATAIGNALVPAATDFVNIVTPMVSGLQQVDPHVISVGLGVAAFAGGTFLAVRAIQAAIPVFSSLVVAYRALATAQAIQKAFAGPAGWATLAVAAGVAGVAIAGIATSFDGIDKASAKAQAAAKSVDNVAASATKATAAVTQLTASAEDFSKVWEKLGKTSLDESLKATEELFKKGEEVANNVRTPQMKFADEITELEQLRQAGAITGDVFQVAFGNANKDLLDAIDSMDKLKQSTQGVGAATQDSVAGFSAVYAAQREADARNKQAAFRDAQMAMVNPAEIFAAVKPLLMPGMRQQPNFAPDDATHRTQFSAMIERQIAYMQQHEADIAETKETIRKREEDSAKVIARLAEIRDASKDSKIIVKEYTL